MNPQNHTCVHASYAEFKSTSEFHYTSIDHSKTDKVKIWIRLFDWTRVKFGKFASEHEVVIPWTYIPKRIDTYDFNKLNAPVQTIVKKYYAELDDKGAKIYKRKDEVACTATDLEINQLTQSMIFKRSKVVWVDFGCNIGNEFGGVHPAVIIKKSGDNLIVLPLSSGEAPSTHSYIVPVPIVYQFDKKIPRWTSVHRMHTIHPKRIEFTSYGSVSGDTMTRISQAIKIEFAADV